MERRPAAPSRAELRHLLVVAALTVVPFVGLATWARLGEQPVWEQGLLNTLLSPAGLPGTFSMVVNAIGNLPIWVWIVAVTSLLMLYRRGLHAGALVALSVASDLAAFAAKLVVESDRPDTAAAEQLFGADSFSFPSGHTVRLAAFIAVVFWLLAPSRMRVPLAVIAGLVAGALMGYARVSLGVHWPTDTVGGTLLGICWFALTTVAVFVNVKPRQKVDGAPG